MRPGERIPLHDHADGNSGGRIHAGSVARAAGASAASAAAASTGASPATATTVEVDLGSTPTWRGKFTITDGAINAAKKVLCWQAPGPYTGKGTRADESELQPISVISVEPLAGSAVVRWETPPMIVMVPVIPSGKRLTPVNLNEQMLSVQSVPTRRGVVRGHVKFTYTVFA